MKHAIPRQELYDLVWSEPMSTVAKRYGISDVALAKACRRHNIPVPKRGWWAKKQAGHNVARVPLPQKKVGMPDEVTVGRNHVPSLTTEWEDEKDKPIEAQLAEIVVGLVVAAEMMRRHDVEERERREREQREEEERQERARLAKREQQRRNVLLKAAIDWRHARYIREYVAAVRAAVPVSAEAPDSPDAGAGMPVQADALTQWSAWALAEADRLDPISAGTVPAMPPEVSGGERDGELH